MMRPHLEVYSLDTLCDTKGLYPKTWLLSLLGVQSSKRSMDPLPMRRQLESCHCNTCPFSLWQILHSHNPYGAQGYSIHPPFEEEATAGAAQKGLYRKTWFLSFLSKRIFEGSMDAIQCGAGFPRLGKGANTHSNNPYGAQRDSISIHPKT